MTPRSSCSSQQSDSSRPSTRKSLNQGRSLLQKKAKFLELASAALEPTSSSPFDAFGKSVAEDLTNMDGTQKIIAQKLISDIVFYGKLGRLSESSSINCADTAPQLPCQAPIGPAYINQQYPYHCNTSYASPFTAPRTSLQPQHIQTSTHSPQFSPQSATTTTFHSQQSQPASMVHDARYDTSRNTSQCDVSNELSEYITLHKA